MSEHQFVVPHEVSIASSVGSGERRLSMPPEYVVDQRKESRSFGETGTLLHLHARNPDARCSALVQQSIQSYVGEAFHD